ncbi:MAG: WG repeat-containing protein [Proteobacteria bacterium]|nr:WG repeat-containing protein [Pseudomonadota bacterium]
MKNYIPRLFLIGLFLTIVTNVYAQNLTLKYDEATGKLGYVDVNEAFVIKPQFDVAYDFKEGLAAVGICNKGKCEYGFIKEDFAVTNEYFIYPQYDDVRNFTEELAAVKVNGKWGFINKAGDCVIEPQFDNTRGFTEGLSPVRVGKERGVIDKTGKYVIKLSSKIKHITLIFSNGLLAVAIGDEWGFIDRDFDKTHKFVIEPQFVFASPFTDGFALVQVHDPETKKDLYGFIDKDFATTHKYFIEPQFDDIDPFSWSLEGVLAVKVDDKWGFINKDFATTHEYVIAPRFYKVSPFYEGHAKVFEQDGTMEHLYIKKINGKWIVALERL